MRDGAEAGAGAGEVPEEGDTCMRVVRSHFHIVETNATLQHSYIPITKKAKQKYTDREIFPVYLREYPILRCQFSSNLCRDSTQSLSK